MVSHDWKQKGRYFDLDTNLYIEFQILELECEALLYQKAAKKKENKKIWLAINCQSDSQYVRATTCRDGNGKLAMYGIWL